MTNKVLHSLNTLERIASGNTLDSYRAAIWFATVIFESKSQYCDKFVLRALEISKSANLTRKVLPHWHSLGIFKTVCFSNSICSKTLTQSRNELLLISCCQLESYHFPKLFIGNLKCLMK